MRKCMYCIHRSLYVSRYGLMVVCYWSVLSWVFPFQFMRWIMGQSLHAFLIKLFEWAFCSVQNDGEHVFVWSSIRIFFPVSIWFYKWIWSVFYSSLFWEIKYPHASDLWPRLHVLPFQFMRWSMVQLLPTFLYFLMIPTF